MSDIQTILSSPPFVVVEGVVNIRTVGGYATSDPQWLVKPMTVFRSGELSHITEAGKEQLHALGVSKVFDFRSEEEISQFKTASPNIEGVEIINVPVYTNKEAFDPANIEKLLKRFEADEIGTAVETYLDVLDMAVLPFKVVFHHLRDKPDELCLVHCTSGKDRTGVFSALLLMLLGVSDQDIIKDYGLTSLGLQPFIPMLTVRYQQQPIFRDNWDGVVKMGASKEETMAATLMAFRERFGSVEIYLRDKLGMTQDDFVTIRRNFLVQKV